MRKAVGDVISDNFCLIKIPQKTNQKKGKIKILGLGANSTKFCIHNLWASRELEMHKSIKEKNIFSTFQSIFKATISINVHG